MIYLTILLVFPNKYFFSVYFSSVHKKPRHILRKFNFVTFATQGEQGAQILVVPELVEFLMSALDKVALFHLLFFTVYLLNTHLIIQEIKGKLEM